ncbi:MAG: leucine--tRNA ligase [Anaerolineae bacterium]
MQSAGWIGRQERRRHENRRKARSGAYDTIANGRDEVRSADYKPAEIEPSWRERWSKAGLTRTTERGSGRPKHYVLEFFPYPSGEGLSVGHVRNYVIGDVVARYKRMRGFDVLHPMGWDAFGLPAENEARNRGRHPRLTTRQYAANYRRQMDLVGVGYDWSREVFSSDPEYYRWTQWLFLLLHERGLAYRGVSRQWWCSECQTVLANEQVRQTPDGPECWRGHAAVSRRTVDQWFLRITEYADRLLTDLDGLDWPDGIVAMQRHWIGRSEGIEVDFVVEADRAAGHGLGPTPGRHGPRGDEAATGSAGAGSDMQPDVISVFTTRPDTLFGVTALVLAPEHPAVLRLSAPGRRAAVADYAAAAARRSEMDRRTDDRPKSGAYTGVMAVHPLTGERLPVWVADYVLPDYGTGAVMLVPAHDHRDAAFAAAFGLPSRSVVESDDDMTSPGVLRDSGPYTGMGSEAGGQAITEALSSRGAGRRTTTYRMRDWSIGRQRFWGAPIPIVHCPACGEVPVPEADLPVLLPDVTDVPVPGVNAAGAPVSPLAAIRGFVETTCPACGAAARRETDTMDGFACSSWYFLRFASPHCASAPFDSAAVQQWLPVDLYIGGAEHAVMHLLYARFWTKVLFDAGLIGFDEPFSRLRNQGMILDETGAKMSKSRPEHLVTPDAAVAAHGADALRAYELFVAPFDQDVAWSESGVSGTARWLRRIWRLALAETRAEAPAEPPSELLTEPPADPAAPSRASADADADALRRATHSAARDVTDALEGFRFNVAVARLMELTNEMVTAQRNALDAAEWAAAVDALLRMLAPIAPHIAEELWSRRGGEGSVHEQSWPEVDPFQAASETFEMVVQVDGKVRDRLVMPSGVSESDAVAATLARPAVVRALGGAEPTRVVFVPGRLVNVVP